MPRSAIGLAVVVIVCWGEAAFGQDVRPLTISGGYGWLGYHKSATLESGAPVGWDAGLAFRLNPLWSVEGLATGDRFTADFQREMKSGTPDAEFMPGRE